MDTYEQLADLLEYPDANWDSRIHVCANDGSLTEFRSGVAAHSLSEIQELYTRTFDLNPVCALEIGYHLFGENYKRGEFLANLRETEASFQLGQNCQLPDYLPVLLRLLTKLQDEELRTSLIGECLIPAIDKMLRPLKESDNPYRFLLKTVRTKLQAEVPLVSAEAPRFNLRAELPVLNNKDLLSGSAAGCAVPAPAHRNHLLKFSRGYAAEVMGIAQESESIAPEGLRPSTHRAAEPQSESVLR